jgi:hypothetical protein
MNTLTLLALTQPRSLHTSVHSDGATPRCDPHD